MTFSSLSSVEIKILLKVELALGAYLIFESRQEGANSKWGVYLKGNAQFVFQILKSDLILNFLYFKSTLMLWH